MTSILIYIAAAIAEIAGCFALCAWLRLGKSALWLVPGTGSLFLFAILLTRIDSAFAGRSCAAYGGIYIIASLGWLWLVEGGKPDRWDIVGVLLCLAGRGSLCGARDQPERRSSAMHQAVPGPGTRNDVTASRL